MSPTTTEARDRAERRLADDARTAYDRRDGAAIADCLFASMRAEEDELPSPIIPPAPGTVTGEGG